MGWATEHLDALKAGTVELQPVVKTLRLGGLEDWGSGWARKVWKPSPELLQDDGGTAPGDGCDASCQIESAWICLGEPSVGTVCGNGVTEGLEQCDDGYTAPGDGCDGSCQIELDWFCLGEPSVCEYCGGDVDCDGDGVPGDQDNCVDRPNPWQGDTDLDGYGNACDADYDNSGAVAGTDFNLFKTYYRYNVENGDHDCTGVVGGTDYGAFKMLYGQPPGRSGLSCAGNLLAR